MAISHYETGIAETLRFVALENLDAKVDINRI
jgi:hypothetical protein